MHRHNQLASAIGLVLTGSLLVSPAHAQNNADTHFAIEEIVVTARKKAESLQSVPIAIEALGAGLLEEKGVRSLEDVAKYSPGLSFDTGLLPNDTRPVIRGISADRGRPNVAVLLDGVDISSESLTVAGGGTTANLKLMDLERVEIVKGPQSVLYGRSAFAGAVNYVTRRPGHEFQAKVSADFNQHQAKEITASIEGSLVDDVLAASVNVLASDDEGYYTNPNTGGKLGQSDTQGIAFGLHFQPNDDFSAYWRTEASRENYGARPVALLGSMAPDAQFQQNPWGTGVLDNGAVLLPVPGTNSDCSQVNVPFEDMFGNPNVCRPMMVGEQGVGLTEADIDLSPDPKTGRDYNGSEIDNFRANLILEWHLGETKFESLTGYTRNESYIQEDFDQGNERLGAFVMGSPFDFSQFGVSADSDVNHELRQISQEFRWSGSADKLDWMVSALYWDEKLETTLASQWWLREGADKDTILAMFAQSPFTSFITDIATGPADEPLYPIPLSRATRHGSGAVSLTYNMADDLRVTAEARYLNEAIEYTGRADSRDWVSLFLLPPGEYNEADRKDTALLPRISVDWQATDTVFGYVSVGKGFKPGGVTTTDGNGDLSEGHYEPEEMIAWEAGVKTTLLDHRLRLNGALFFNDYTNQQVPFTSVTPAGLANVSVVNAGKSQITGFEFDFDWRLLESLSVYGGYTFSDAKFEEFNTRDAMEKSGINGTISFTDMILAGNEDADFSGKQMTMQARHTGSIGGRYELNFEAGSLFADWNSRYMSRRYLDRGNQSWLPAHWVSDMSLGWQAENWHLIGYVDNVFNDDKVKSGIGNVDYGLFPDGQSIPWALSLYMPQPRTAGIRAQVTF